MKKFLILQLRPEAPAADNEYQAILDKGGLAAERTHRIRLDCEDIPADLDPADYAGVIVGGGPGCVSDAEDKKSPVEKRIESSILSLMPEITGRDLPFMGCCYGIGILGHHLGAPVTKERYGEPVGTSTCRLTDDGRDDAMLAGCPDVFDAFVGHKEALQVLPEDCVQLLASDPCPYQMVRYKQNVYATQFHPEADAKVFELRTHIYKDRGYFAPDEVERLLEMIHAADVHAPELILRNFVARYG